MIVHQGKLRREVKQVRTFAMIFPPVYLVAAVIILFLIRGHRWGQIPLLLLGVVNFAAIWLLAGGSNPDYFFGCLAATATMGLVWIGITILWVYDLLIGRFFRQFGLIIGFTSSFWWLNLLITHLG
jgi:hypothetical protein